MRVFRLAVLLCAAAVLSIPVRAADDAVTVKEAPLVAPTYPAADPDPSPLFFEGRTYQGARGPIYPYPIIDKLFETKQDRTYKAVWLENEYVRIGILPEIGGRIFEAVDKTNNYDFFYRQHVIKPALIGLIGAWISGGVEWNIPHHHRASTLPAGRSTGSRRTPTAARRSGWASWNCATACAGPSATRFARQVVPRGLGAHRQPHAGGQHDALLRQRRRPRQQGLPGHLPAQHPVRDPPPQGASSPPGRSPRRATGDTTFGREPT